MKDLSELLDYFPFCFVLLLFLTIVPSLEGSQDFPVHRLAHYELSGTTFGSKITSIAMDARSLKSSNILRKVVVTHWKDLTISGFNDIINMGIGALLIVLPLSFYNISESLALEEHLSSGSLEIPVFFASETPHLLELISELQTDVLHQGSSSSIWNVLSSHIISSGHQLVTNGVAPKAVSDSTLVTIHGQLSGRGDEDLLPTIVIVSHYDAGGVAPGLSFGAESNGSGVAMLLELARLWSKLYSTSRTHPKYNLVFVLTAGGKINYFGSKKWLEQHQDSDQNSELLSNVSYVICLDSIGGDFETGKLNIHVSKPPKEESIAGKFIQDLRSVASKLTPTLKVNVIHKKINLAEETLSWEHERYSIRRLPAFTLSQLETHSDSRRFTIMDKQIYSKSVHRNLRLIAEALACTIYNNNHHHNCSGLVFNSSLSPSLESINSWLEFLASTPRSASLLTNSGKVLHPLVATLQESIKSYTHVLTTLSSKRDKREPEFTFFDDGQTSSQLMHTYHVKPAVFDLVLTLAISAYLGLIYLLLAKSEFILLRLRQMTTQLKKSESNGVNKIKSH